MNKTLKSQATQVISVQFAANMAMLMAGIIGTIAIGGGTDSL